MSKTQLKMSDFRLDELDANPLILKIRSMLYSFEHSDQTFGTRIEISKINDIIPPIYKEPSLNYKNKIDRLALGTELFALQHGNTAVSSIDRFLAYCTFYGWGNWVNEQQGFIEVRIYSHNYNTTLCNRTK